MTSEGTETGPRMGEAVVRAESAAGLAGLGTGAVAGPDAGLPGNVACCCTTGGVAGLTCGRLDARVAGWTAMGVLLLGRRWRAGVAVEATADRDVVWVLVRTELAERVVEGAAMRLPGALSRSTSSTGGST